jgi:hypothetical protein
MFRESGLSQAKGAVYEGYKTMKTGGVNAF